MTKVEILIVACIIVIFASIGYSTLNDDRPVRCFEGFKYKVGSDGALHLMTAGKFGISVRCDS